MSDSAAGKKSDTAKREEEVLAFWKKNRIFEESLEKKAPRGEFIFYDGPPFATGLPHSGSLLSSVIKDVIPRYKTMRGFRVERRFGWDCHGLPIENMIEQRLNLKTKKDILTVGIGVFNEAARASVMEFEHEWEKYVNRIGRWVDFKNSYKTMDNSYMESVWWGLKQLHEKGRLYEGLKVLMYCPHCETPLAKAEIAQDHTYKDITEEAVTVKFHLKPGQKFGKYETKDTAYILAWTTTPWTLPGNVALAVGKDILYTALRVKGEEGLYIVASELAQKVFEDKKIETVHDDIKGKDLVSLQYEPLFNLPALKSEKSYKVYAADFVTTHEGTGIVHTAVMYGEDDFALGQKENLPRVQILDASAHYNNEAPEFIRGKYIKQAEKFIKEDLEERGLLFSKEKHTHSYPHCYRCGTPLIYNAAASWFINIQKVKQKMLQENEKIQWVPEHLKHGRFGHIVENAPDWTISRNRFWASPLPIWKEKGGKRLMVIGSMEELKRRTKRSGNRYFVVRHGQAENMLQNILTVDAEHRSGLTELGTEQAVAAAKEISREKPIVIISSPVRRTRETAEIIARELDIAPARILFDERLREIGFGIFDGKRRTEWEHFFERPDWYTARPEGGESFEDAAIRFGEAMYEFESSYKDSTVVIVTHGIGFKSLFSLCRGERGGGLLHLIEAAAVHTGEVDELPFVPLPLNAKFELDLHRPYIDALTLLDEEGREYERIPEVVDCWVESGSMPFAQLHYPFENKEQFEKHFPGDFIAEYIAQTRTWFYYMHALGVSLFDSLAFCSVVSTGTILAQDGAKISKSKKNYTDPLVLLNQYGADAFRLYLMGSVVMQAEDLRFRDEDVREAHARTVGILWNSYKFFELYKGEYDAKTQSKDSPHPLDSWVRSRLGQLITEVTGAMDAYDTPSACRALKLFVDDYSTWYVRRSRERVKTNSREGGDAGPEGFRGRGAQDKQFALATQRDALLTLSKLTAPLMPFIAESMYRGVGGEKQSVHLEDWPERIPVDNKILADMALARAVASRGLEARDRAGIKIRQPLSLLEARELPEKEALRAIIAEEVNVKRVAESSALEENVRLDVELTDELREEGTVREAVRAIQAARKKEGLSVADRPKLTLSTDAGGAALFNKFKEQIAAQTGLAALAIEEGGDPAPEGRLFPMEFKFKK